MNNDLNNDLNNEETAKRPFLPRTSDRVLLIISLVLALLTGALLILQKVGLSLIDGAIMIYLPLLTLFVLVGWGGYALIRRIYNQTVRMIVGGVLGLLLVLAVMMVYTYVSYMAFYLIPQKYSAMVSPTGGHRLVVMRGFDTVEEHHQQRKAARLAADPDATEEDVISDWGYMYRAYPQVLGLFYKTNANVEGEVYLDIEEPNAQPQSDQAGEATQAEAEPKAPHGTLMVEWLDNDATAHFFVENPGVAEGGDCYVRF